MISIVLKDLFGRPVTNLRVSLTSRCNLTCIYCHKEGERSTGREMTTEEVQQILSVASEFGITSVKFTGGEPLIREDLLEIIRSVPKGIETSITTNGLLLERLAPELKEAGLNRLNVSLDSLNPETYKKITGCDRLSDVISGIDAALHVGLTPVKINMVLLEGINETEVEDFLSFVRMRHDLILQIIELMNLSSCTSHKDLGLLEKDLASRSQTILTRRMHHRKKYCIDGAEVEIVRPLHNTTFCSFCNRLRVTADGRLKPCLMRSDNTLDLRGKSREEMRELFTKAVMSREPFFR